MIARSATAAWLADAAATSPLLKLSMNFWMGAISGASAAVAAPPMTMQTMIPRVRYRILHSSMVHVWTAIASQETARSSRHHTSRYGGGLRRPHSMRRLAGTCYEDRSRPLPTPSGGRVRSLLATALAATGGVVPSE